MKTYPIVEQDQLYPFAFEIERAQLRTAALVRILKDIPGITHVDLKNRRATSSDIRISFHFSHQLYVIWEPKLSTGRYRIGPVHAHNGIADVAMVEQAFKDYRTPFQRAVRAKLEAFGLPFKRGSKT
ncbi:MAG: hypothetical protein V4724_16905 [Pseudomonadota bacterium]